MPYHSFSSGNFPPLSIAKVSLEFYPKLILIFFPLAIHSPFARFNRNANLPTANFEIPRIQKNQQISKSQSKYMLQLYIPVFNHLNLTIRFLFSERISNSSQFTWRHSHEECQLQRKSWNFAKPSERFSTRLSNRNLPNRFLLDTIYYPLTKAVNPMLFLSACQHSIALNLAVFYLLYRKFNSVIQLNASSPI